jgi:hypothetical protein
MIIIRIGLVFTWDLGQVSAVTKTARVLFAYDEVKSYILPPLLALSCPSLIMVTIYNNNTNKQNELLRSIIGAILA